MSRRVLLSARHLGTALAGVVLLTSCSAAHVPVTKAPSAAPLNRISANALPSQVAGLDLQSEAVPSRISNASASYASGIGFFSLRSKKLVEATLELIKLDPQAQGRSKGFKTSLVNQVSGSLPTQLTLDGRTVFQSAGTGATQEMWFSGAYLFILTIRSSYTTPRTLTESALSVEVQ